MKLPTLDDRIYDDYETYTPGRDSLYDDIDRLRPRSPRVFPNPRAPLSPIQFLVLAALTAAATFGAVLLLLRSIFG